MEIKSEACVALTGSGKVDREKVEDLFAKIPDNAEITVEGSYDYGFEEGRMCARWTEEV